jgi:hypothetical protein
VKALTIPFLLFYANIVPDGHSDGYGFLTDSAHLVTNAPLFVQNTQNFFVKAILIPVFPFDNSIFLWYNISWIVIRPQWVS